MQEVKKVFRIIPDNLCRQSSLKEGSIAPHSLHVGCTWWLLSKEFNMDRGWEGKITLQWRNLTNTASAKWSKSTSTVINHDDSVYPCHDVMKMALYLCGLPPPNPNLTMRKTSNSKGNIYKYLIFLKIVKIGEAWERLPRGARGAKEIWQLNVICVLDGISEQKWKGCYVNN